MPVSLTSNLALFAAFFINKIGKKENAIFSFEGALELNGSWFASSLIKHLSWLFLIFSFPAIGSSLLIKTFTLTAHYFIQSDHRFHMSAKMAYQYAFPFYLVWMKLFRGSFLNCFFVSGKCDILTCSHLMKLSKFMFNSYLTIYSADVFELLVYKLQNILTAPFWTVLKFC